MNKAILIRRAKIALLLGGTASILVFNYSNCAPVAFNQAASNSSTAVGGQDLSGTVTVGATGTNPPLDLFFIVDNSASMYENQVKLGASFNNIFQSNLASLSNFNVNVYLFSTASAVYLSGLSQVPTRSPASITSIPAYSDLTDLLATPGSVYSYWDNASGTYGTAPFSEQFDPAPVLSLDSSGNYNQGLSLAKQGSQTTSQYQAAISALSKDFQNRLNYLNPGNQFQSGTDPVSSVTDVSSALCSTARILKHSSNFIQPGDAAAFVIVSDDDDRLNDRNPNNDQCLEAINASSELINGSCGHYQANYTYDTTSSVSYQSNSKFTYDSGTNFPYTYGSSATCSIQYSNGYSYSWTYTALNTVVTYTKCTEMADGFCVNSVPNSTATLSGDYVGTGGTCLSSVNNLVSNIAPGTNPTCAANNISNQNGSTGVDPYSNGQACSSQTIASLSSNPAELFTSCTITGPHTTSKSVTGQALNSCPNYCATNASQYPGCTLLSSSIQSTTKTLSVNGIGLTCNSQCPAADSSQCGTGTISSYISSLQAGATCGTPTNSLSTITVLAGADSSGNKISCSTSLGSFGVQNSNGTVICAGQSTVSSCIESILPGGSASCTANGGSTASLTAPVNMSCSTACSSSNGFCPSTYTTIASYIAQVDKGLCTGASNGGQKSLSLIFSPAYAQNANCNSLCSQVANGSCDGKGYGATNGATVSQYISSLNGAACSPSVAQVLTGSQFAAPDVNPQSSCTDPNNTVFFPSGSAYAGTATTYTAGDINHKASDFEQYIVSQSTSVFGANTPVVAVIGHLTTDPSLTATDPGTDYFNLASDMGSTQISSVTASDYSTALSNVSNFIVQQTQNSFALGLPAGSVVYAVSVEHSGGSTWTSINSSLWTWTGSTLSVNKSAGLVIGDQLMFQYNN